MKKGILILGAILATSLASVANAEDMMRYEQNYYKSGKTEIPFEQDEKKADQNSSSKKVSTVKSTRQNHPITEEPGLIRDR